MVVLAVVVVVGATHHANPAMNGLTLMLVVVVVALLTGQGMAGQVLEEVEEAAVTLGPLMMMTRMMVPGGPNPRSNGSLPRWMEMLIPNSRATSNSLSGSSTL
jgi:hypothetical protein